MKNENLEQWVRSQSATAQAEAKRVAAFLAKLRPAKPLANENEKLSTYIGSIHGAYQGMVNEVALALGGKSSFISTMVNKEVLDSDLTHNGAIENEVNNEVLREMRTVGTYEPWLWARWLGFKLFELMVLLIDVLLLWRLFRHFYGGMNGLNAIAMSISCGLGLFLAVATVSELLKRATHPKDNYRIRRWAFAAIGGFLLALCLIRVSQADDVPMAAMWALPFFLMNVFLVFGLIGLDVLLAPSFKQLLAYGKERPKLERIQTLNGVRMQLQMHNRGRKADVQKMAEQSLLIAEQGTLLERLIQNQYHLAISLFKEENLIYREGEVPPCFNDVPPPLTFYYLDSPMEYNF